MFGIKESLGIIALLITFASYVPYTLHILRGQTKPHAFSWFIWGLSTGIVFIVQLFNGGGPGAWVLGVTSVVCFAIAIAGLVVGQRTFDKYDWASLLLVLGALALWRLTNQPLLAVILVTIADAIGFIPSFRKGLVKPNEETLSVFVMTALKHTFSLMALQSYIVENWLFPVVMVVLNFLFVAAIYMQRRKHSVENG